MTELGDAPLYGYMNHPNTPTRHAQSGYLLPAIMIAVMLASWLAVHQQKTSHALHAQWNSVQKAEQTIRNTARQQAAQQAASLLGAEATLPADGYPLPPLPDTGTAPPAGGGFVPATSKAPKTDGSKTFGYCAWDNGATTTTTGYIAGVNAPASNALAVISSGKDGLFQTTCTQANGGTPQGDDIVVVVATTQLRRQVDLP